MSFDLAGIFWLFSIFVILLGIAGAYCILVTFNLIRALLGLELLIKAATLLIILAGYLTHSTGLAQALVVTLIVIEVVVMVVAGGIILSLFRHYKTIDARKLTQLKG
ncbi:MAG: NADH-quinone oxidoreductase subunit K [Candidatus Omnitrophota bacterium]|jgi:multisubunit Na+/H+ antiporter MnhC subunit